MSEGINVLLGKENKEIKEVNKNNNVKGVNEVDVEESNESVKDNEITQVEPRTKGEKVSDEILEQIFSDEYLEKKTDLNRKSAMTFTIANSMADIFNCDILRDFAEVAKKHLISNKRKGRTEMVESIQNISETTEQPDTFMDKMFKGN